MSYRHRLSRHSKLFCKAVRYIRCRNLKRLSHLLRRCPELLRQIEHGHSLLDLAVWQRQSEIVEYLLQHGADPDFAEAGGNTPLIHAAAENDLQVARLLLEYGAEIDKPNGRQETPLGFACSYDAVDVVELLCESGADVNGTEDWGHSYLWAVRCGKQLEVERILLKYGAQVIHMQPRHEPNEATTESQPLL